jgi:hypothetical protein
MNTRRAGLICVAIAHAIANACMNAFYEIRHQSSERATTDAPGRKVSSRAQRNGSIFRYWEVTGTRKMSH